MRVSNRISVTLLFLSVAVVLFATISHKYLWLYVSRKLRGSAPASRVQIPRDSNNPDVLLAEADRLAWFFNWPRAEPFYVRAEELFKEKGDTRNEICARVGRIRAQSETMSWPDVSQMIDHERQSPIVKSDARLKPWCLAQKGYIDLDFNPASAKRAWAEAKNLLPLAEGVRRAEAGASQAAEGPRKGALCDGTMAEP